MRRHAAGRDRRPSHRGRARWTSTPGVPLACGPRHRDVRGRIGSVSRLEAVAAPRPSCGSDRATERDAATAGCQASGSTVDAVGARRRHRHPAATARRAQVGRPGSSAAHRAHRARSPSRGSQRRHADPAAHVRSLARAGHLARRDLWTVGRADLWTAHSRTCLRRTIAPPSGAGMRRHARRPLQLPGHCRWVAAGERAGAGRGRDHRPGAAGGLRAVPAAQRRPRPDLLPRHAAAAAGQAAARARALRLRPLRRRARRRPRLARPRPRWSAWGDAVPRRPRARRQHARRPDQPGRRSTPPAPGTSRPSTFEAFLASRCGWTSPSPATRPTPTSSTTCTARPPSSACRWCRSSSRSTRAPPATPRRSARRSSCPTSSATSAEDLRRGRVYLPQEDLDRFGVTRADLAPGPTPPHVRELLALRDRPHPRAVRRRRARHRPAAPDQPRLHPHRVRALRRHPRRGREGRLPGARPPGGRAAAPPARGRRPRPGQGPSGAAAPGDRGRLSRRPHHTHHACVCSTSEKPNSRSSTGAKTSRAPEDRVVVVDHDVAPGEPPVGEQLEDQRRSRTPSRTTRRVTTPGAQHDQVEHQRRHHADHRQRGVAHSSPAGQPRTLRTASNASSAQVGTTTKNSSSSSGSAAGQHHARSSAPGRRSSAPPRSRRGPTRRRPRPPAAASAAAGATAGRRGRRATARAAACRRRQKASTAT